MSKEFLLPRDGRPPLAFAGEMVREADGNDSSGRVNRWHALALYRTESGKWVGAIEFHTRWQGERGRKDAAVFDTPAAAAAWFSAYNPIPAGIGFPEGDHYAGKQARLGTELGNGYARLVTELLDDSMFAERV